jgi:hypothetical protein
VILWMALASSVSAMVRSLESPAPIAATIALEMFGSIPGTLINRPRSDRRSCSEIYATKYMRLAGLTGDLQPPHRERPSAIVGSVDGPNREFVFLIARQHCPVLHLDQFGGFPREQVTHRLTQDLGPWQPKQLLGSLVDKRVAQVARILGNDIRDQRGRLVTATERKREQWTS